MLITPAMLRPTLDTTVKALVPHARVFTHSAVRSAVETAGKMTGALIGTAMMGGAIWAGNRASRTISAKIAERWEKKAQMTEAEKKARVFLDAVQHNRDLERSARDAAIAADKARDRAQAASAAAEKHADMVDQMVEEVKSDDDVSTIVEKHLAELRAKDERLAAEEAAQKDADARDEAQHGQLIRTAAEGAAQRAGAAAQQIMRMRAPA